MENCLLGKSSVAKKFAVHGKIDMKFDKCEKKHSSTLSRVLFSSKACTVGGVFDVLVLFPAMAQRRCGKGPCYPVSSIFVWLLEVLLSSVSAPVVSLSGSVTGWVLDKSLCFKRETTPSHHLKKTYRMMGNENGFHCKRVFNFVGLFPDKQKTKGFYQRLNVWSYRYVVVWKREFHFSYAKS